MDSLKITYLSIGLTIITSIIFTSTEISAFESIIPSERYSPLHRFGSSVQCSGKGREGVCYGEVKCNSFYGTTSGYCTGLGGACCIFYRSCEGKTLQKVSHFLNPNYPNESKIDKQCKYVIRKPHAGYCGLRLDLKTLRLPGQVGFCSDTYFSISGLPNRRIELICGKFKNQKYIFDISSASEIALAMESFSGYRTIWDIQVTLLLCSEFTSQILPSIGDGGSGKLVSLGKPVKQPTISRPIKENYSICGQRSRKFKKRPKTVRESPFIETKDAFKSDEWSVPTLTDSLFYQRQTEMSPQLLTPRITFGEISTEGSHPWQIAIYKNGNRFHCGGTIVSTAHIVTAAHCLRKAKARDLMVVAGAFDLRRRGRDKTVRQYQVEQIWSHPSFSSRTLQNDIAVLKLSQDMTYTEKIRPLCLPYRDFHFTGNIATVTGWGKDENKRLVSKLHELTAEVLNNTYCEQRWNPHGITNKNQFIVNSMICMNPQNGDSCNGDSGGPLTLEYPENSGNHFIIGVVSFGSGSCMEPGLPGVYTNVYSYIDWIKDRLTY